MGPRAVPDSPRYPWEKETPTAPSAMNVTSRHPRDLVLSVGTQDVHRIRKNP